MHRHFRGAWLRELRCCRQIHQTQPEPYAPSRQRRSDRRRVRPSNLRIPLSSKNSLAFGREEQKAERTAIYETELEPATTTRIPRSSQSRRRLSFDRSVTTTSI